MVVTHGYLARGTDVLIKFNAIENFPSLLTQIASLDKMTIPGQARPIAFDNGNVGGNIVLEILVKNTPYDKNEHWGSTGTIFDQFFEMKRVVYNSGRFLAGKKPTKISGTKDYNITSRFSYFLLTLLFPSEGGIPFSKDFSLFNEDGIREDKQGIIVPVIPTTISFKSTNKKNNMGVVNITFEYVSNVISFRS